MKPAKQLYLDANGRVVDEHLYHIFTILPELNSNIPATKRAIVQRYNVHEALVQALRMLVELKEYCEQHGKDAQRKSHVWAVARAALVQVKEAE
jgi:hypothetical protein